ncbi:Bifunctional epoxide hydrolase 2 [Mortierella hygrophila]|uniref:Bifunctional epoxide hydrolase 2 n=1 Tax=Mortierella hygrophila TaxID=979708 RepID=A0A9P6FCS1_9FUNG|nr:Bifunctional epoxide hydrolase 2 [Mortierella hygrophila]
MSTVPSMRTYLEMTLANVAYIDAADAAKPATAPEYEPSSFNHKYTTLGGHKYHYVEEGDSNNQTVVLIHGFPDLWYGWRYQIRHLVSQGFHVIAVDDLGSGETDQPKCVGLDVEPYSSKNLATNLVELLDQLNVDKAVFIGHDWGSFIAWKAGMYFPERCHAIISIGNPHRQPTVSPTGTKELAAENPLFFYMPEFEGSEIESWFDGNAKTFATGFFNMVYGGKPGTNAQEKQYYIDTFSRTSFHGALNYYRAFLINHKDELPYVGKPYTVPSLLIKAEGDQILTPDYVRGVPYDLFVDLEQSSIVVGGHYVQNEAADEVNQELTRYLNRLFDEKLKIPKTKAQAQKNAISQEVQEQSAQTVACEE